MVVVVEVTTLAAILAKCVGGFDLAIDLSIYFFDGLEARFVIEVIFDP